MRIKQIYCTFMGQHFEDEEKCLTAEKQEYEDVALAVKKWCKEREFCEGCPFSVREHCLFHNIPARWQLNSDCYHDYEMQAKVEDLSKD